MGISVCYIDEAGCTGILPVANSPIQPALIISALIVDLEKVKQITNSFIRLKVNTSLENSLGSSMTWTP